MGGATPFNNREGEDGWVGVGVSCGAFPDLVHATATPGAGRGRGVQREMKGRCASVARRVRSGLGRAVCVEPPKPFGLLAARGCCAWAATRDSTDGYRENQGAGGTCIPGVFQHLHVACIGYSGVPTHNHSHFTTLTRRS